MFRGAIDGLDSDFTYVSDEYATQAVNHPSQLGRRSTIQFRVGEGVNSEDIASFFGIQDFASGISPFIRMVSIACPQVLTIFNEGPMAPTDPRLHLVELPDFISGREGAI